MIIDPRMATFIDSMDPGNPPYLDELEKEAIAGDIPIIRKPLQSFFRFLLRYVKPKSILEVGTAIGFSAILMSEYAPTDCKITTIEKYEKRIPVAGGLAGGSTDAAATLVLLNGFFGEVLTFSELLDLGARIGSDVPFCILGGTVLARGRGEKLTPITPARKYHFLVANGGAPVSTAEAYRELDRRSEERGFDEKFPDPLIRSLKDGAPIDDYLFNSFEYVSLPAHPEAARAHRVISDNGGTPLLSGSGPSVFGVFDDLSLRANAKKQLEEEDYLVFECESV